MTYEIHYDIWNGSEIDCRAMTAEGSLEQIDAVLLGLRAIGARNLSVLVDNHFVYVNDGWDYQSLVVCLMGDLATAKGREAANDKDYYETWPLDAPVVPY